MRVFFEKSSFGDLPIEVFLYEASEKNRDTIFLLKGLYGLHIPDGDSWDNDLIRVLLGKYNVVCINTARVGSNNEERSSQDAFTGKSFRDECDDVFKSWERLVREGVIVESNKVHIVGNSFGGTTLLGLPELMSLAESILFIGSGCGKSPITTKPLLATLFDEERLLESIRGYKGNFVFIQGSEDIVVPKESQDKIIASAENARTVIIYKILGVRHDLKPSSDVYIFDRVKTLTSILEHTINL